MSIPHLDTGAEVRSLAHGHIVSLLLVEEAEYAPYPTSLSFIETDCRQSVIIIICDPKMLNRVIYIYIYIYIYIHTHTHLHD